MKRIFIAAAATAVMCAPFTALTAPALTPVAHACPPAFDGSGNNNTAIHNACCNDARMSGQGGQGCEAPARVPA
ncbi:MAG: hypothetical protein ACRDTV_11620, partial [Mycobacterium sp.]